jgi:4-amino-4-deoxy-L-arabinose transferase-like glycosyltransferase
MMRDLGTAMKVPGTARFALPHNGEKSAVIVLYPALALYLFLRIFSWLNASLLESRDSMSFLRDAKAFLSFELSRIINLPPDAAPIYPLMSAILSLPGWSVENGARLCSVFFSVIAFLSLAAIAKRLSTPQAVFLTLFLLAINPVMIELSRSVLTEPAYIGVVYLGLWLFHRQQESPSWRSGALLGGIFALAFLARTEGLIFIAAIPVLQLVLSIFFQKERNLKNVGLWAAAFVICFAAVSAPQIWRVSHKMGHFAINGRQVWEVILNNPDGKSYDQKIYGLDYSPQQINLEYIQSHPEVVKSMASSVSLSGVARKIAGNIKEFFRRKMPALIGPFGVLFAVLGILSLWRDRQYASLMWMAGSLGACLAGPFLHDVDVRHIAVITPMLALLQGIGMVFFCMKLAEVELFRSYSRLFKKSVPYILLVIILAGFLSPLYAAVLPPRANRDYAIDDYNAALAIIQQQKQQKPGAELRIAARKGYLVYMAGAREVFLPFTDYSGLVEYCRLNRVDMIFMEHEALRSFPFYKNFVEHATPNLELLDRYESKSHGVLELYEVLSKY